MALLGPCWLGRWFLFHHWRFVLAFKYLVGVQLVHKGISFFREESCVDGYRFIHVKPLLKDRMVGKEEVKNQTAIRHFLPVPLHPRALILIIHHITVSSLQDKAECPVIRICKTQLQPWSCPTFQAGKRRTRHKPKTTFPAV